MAATLQEILSPEAAAFIASKLAIIRANRSEMLRRMLQRANRAFLEQSGQIEVAVDEITINPEADAPFIVDKNVG